MAKKAIIGELHLWNKIRYSRTPTNRTLIIRIAKYPDNFEKLIFCLKY